MGLFGGLKSAVQGFGQINPESGLSGADRLAAIGSILMGDPNGQRDLSQLAASRAQATKKQQMQQQLAQLLGPAAGAPQIGEAGGANAGGLPSLRAIAPQLMQMQLGGMDVSPYVSLLDKVGPEVKYERGMRYDGRDPGKAPAFIPDMDKGQMPLFDAQGNIVAVRNIDGSVQSAAEMAGAVEGAKRAAGAPYDFVNLPTPTGAPMVASKAQALGGVFTGQSPADALRAKAKAEAETGAQIDLPKLRDQASTTLGLLDKIRKHPSLGDRTGNSTLLPAIRPADVDFDVMVQQVSGGAFLEAIAYLKGTGQITEIEGKKATDAIARMSNQRQSQEGFLAAMNDYETIVKAGLGRAEQKAGARTTGARPDRSAVEAELRRRGLIR